MDTMCYTFEVPRYKGPGKNAPKVEKWCVSHGRWYNKECEQTEKENA
jgi:hypothetical protein